MTATGSAYLVLGGDTYSTNYLGVNDVKVEGEEFASAGLGLNIPLSKIFNNWWCERNAFESEC
jgi:hypothetical protein